MSDTRAGDRATFFMLGAAIGAVAALLMAAGVRHTHSPEISPQGKNVADYLIDAGALVQTAP